MQKKKNASINNEFVDLKIYFVFADLLGHKHKNKNKMKIKFKSVFNSREIRMKRILINVLHYNRILI